jgi:hypothetical protein
MRSTMKMMCNLPHYKGGHRVSPAWSVDVWSSKKVEKYLVDGRVDGAMHLSKSGCVRAQGRVALSCRSWRVDVACDIL